MAGCFMPLHRSLSLWDAVRIGYQLNRRNWVQGVYLLPYHTGLARPQIEHRVSVPRVTNMLLSPSSFDSR